MWHPTHFRGVYTKSIEGKTSKVKSETQKFRTKSAEVEQQLGKDPGQEKNNSGSYPWLLKEGYGWHDLEELPTNQGTALYNAGNTFGTKTATFHEFHDKSTNSGFANQPLIICGC